MNEPMQLCPPCLLNELKRNEAACNANPDKDVAWWIRYWDKSQERQIKQMTNHCYAN